MSLQVAGVNQADSFGLLRVDLRLSVRAFAIAQRFVVVKGDFALQHGYLVSKVNVLAHRLTLCLSEAAEQSDEKFAGLCQGVDVFFLKDDGDAAVFESTDNLEAVHGVPGKTGGGFGEDHVDPAPLACGDHPVELHPLLQAGAAEVLISEGTGHLPIEVFLDFLCIVVLLGLVAVELLPLLVLTQQ